MSEPPQKKDSLDEVLNKVDLSEKTEMGEVANNIFQKGAGRTNLTDDEVCLVFINNAIFKGLGLNHLNPVDSFMELKKSHNGWSTEKFVQSTSGLANMRSGGTFGMAIKEKLFSPRQ